MEGRVGVSVERTMFLLAGFGNLEDGARAGSGNSAEPLSLRSQPHLAVLSQHAWGLAC